VNRRAIVSATWRGALALGLIGAAALAAGPRILAPLIPVYWRVTEWLLPDHYCRVLLVDTDGGLSSAKLRLETLTLQAIELANGATLAPGVTLFANTDLSSGLLPVLVMGVLLAAWPTPRRADRVALLAVGFSILLVVQAVTVPFLLAGAIESMEAQVGGSTARIRSLASLWYYALNNGGAYAAPLAGVLLAVGIVRPRPAVPGPVTTGSPPVRSAAPAPESSPAPARTGRAKRRRQRSH
jgi:hypothetical protein